MSFTFHAHFIGNIQHTITACVPGLTSKQKHTLYTNISTTDTKRFFSKSQYEKEKSEKTLFTIISSKQLHINHSTIL